MADLCEDGNEPPGSLKAINCPKTGLNITSDNNKAPLMRQLNQKITSRSKSGVKRTPIYSDALKKTVEPVMAPPGNKISIREEMMANTFFKRLHPTRKTQCAETSGRDCLAQITYAPVPSMLSRLLQGAKRGIACAQRGVRAELCL
ncbi:hypothetical protein ANN_20699 [Periplaneta americana]|uniref:Uncharacterized protein n=1 Tax=Periplaneta americana TaxID=6978 RepID=A0ABQ8SDH7_PERAM|nr:hypothetical protein ANN_20699 [Periplaneta americana]